MNTEVMFSKKSDEWETPQDFFDELNKEFGFTLDVCATAKNKKCERWFASPLDNQIYGCIVDGLINEWAHEVCWMNPPYSQIGKWMQKAYEESLYGATVVCLVPARTDTKWFHDYVYGKAETRFVKGRLKFGGSKNSAPFPSMVVIYRG